MGRTGVAESELGELGIVYPLFLPRKHRVPAFTAAAIRPHASLERGELNNPPVLEGLHQGKVEEQFT